MVFHTGARAAGCRGCRGRWGSGVCGRGWWDAGAIVVLFSWPVWVMVVCRGDAGVVEVLFSGAAYLLGARLGQEEHPQDAAEVYRKAAALEAENTHTTKHAVSCVRCEGGQAAFFDSRSDGAKAMLGVG